MDDRPSQFRQQRIPPGVSDCRQLSKPVGKIFGEAMHTSGNLILRVMIVFSQDAIMTPQCTIGYPYQLLGRLGSCSGLYSGSRW